MTSARKCCLAVRHVAFENAGVLAELLNEFGCGLSYVEAGVSPLPAQAAQDCDLLLVLGGPIGVYETEAYPFLRQELDVVRKRLEARRPTLGLCLGAQMMAAALGAGVAPGPAKEIGYGSIELTSEGVASPLAALAGVPVLHWHGDNLQLPTGGVRLASTPACPNQAFALGDYALGLQFHVEVQPSQLEAWLIGHACELAKEGLDPRDLRAQAIEHGERANAAGRQALRQWLKGILA